MPLSQMRLTSCKKMLYYEYSISMSQYVKLYLVSEGNIYIYIYLLNLYIFLTAIVTSYLAV